MQTLTIALEKIVFFPANRVTDDTSVLTLKNLVFEPLCRWEHGQSLPGLFARWDHSADGRQWRFYLRDDATFIGLLRASAQSEEAADAMRLFFMQGVLPRLGAVVADGSAQRAALAGSLIVGLAWSRYILVNPPLAALTRAELVALVQPALDAALFGA